MANLFRLAGDVLIPAVEVEPIRGGLELSVGRSARWLTAEQAADLAAALDATADALRDAR